MMELWRKPAFRVMGLEGSTEEGSGMVARLWEQANARFVEVAGFAARREDGSLLGVWGAMTDFARTFQPWEEGFSRGLYLAGVECTADAQPPEGWTCWDVPGFAYVRVEADDTAFARGLALLAAEGLTLQGAVQDYTDPAAGKSWMCFPVERLPG
jgi:hypothetical protein